MKICVDCKKELNDDMFGKNRADCYSCKYIRDKRWKANNKKNVRKSIQKWRSNNSEKNLLSQRRNHYKIKYGITFERFVEMVGEQSNRCANIYCREELGIGKHEKNTACLDHNHKTGEIRGILCRHCNNILGEMEKNGKIIKGLEKYLRKYGKVVRNNTKNKRKN